MSDPYASFSTPADPYADFSAPVQPSQDISTGRRAGGRVSGSAGRTRPQTVIDTANAALRTASNAHPAQGMELARRTYGRDRPGGVHNSFGNQILASTGVTDEVGGGLAYGAQAGINALTGVFGQRPRMSASDAYNAAAEAERAARDEYAQQHPALNVLATVGGIGTAAPAAAGAGTINVLSNATRLGRAGNAGINAAVAGAPIAYANQEGNALQRIPGTLAGSALSGAGGAGLNYVGEVAGAAARAAAARPPSPQRVLANARVDMTPGRLLGGPFAAVEDLSTSIPFSGVGTAQDRSVGSLNRAIANDALEPIGQRLPRNVRPGHAAVQHVKTAISNHYNSALSPITVAPDAQLGTDVTTALAGVRNARMRADTRSVVDDIMSDFNGPISGRDWKSLDERLGAAAAAADRGARTNPVMRQQAGALRDVQTALRGTLQRTDPNAAQAVRQADAAYARFVRLRRAASSAAAARHGGVATPAALNSAVTSNATTDQVSRGVALTQNLTGPAMEVLPSKVGSSGTADRRLWQIILTGGLAGGGHMAGPAGDAAVALGLTTTALTALAYSRPAIAALNAIYRASGRVPAGQAEAAIAVLAREAARNPALEPIYQQALGHVRQPATQQPTTQRQPQPTG